MLVDNQWEIEHTCNMYGQPTGANYNMFEVKQTLFELNIFLSMEDNVSKTETCLYMYIAKAPGQTFSFIIILCSFILYHI